MKSLGVIGSGNMGSGIAQSGAQYGYEVVIFDIQKENLVRSKDSITSSLYKRVRKSKMTINEADRIIQRILFTSRIHDLMNCEIIIEAVFENLEIKKSLMAEIESFANKDALLATNTSSLSITDIASNMKNSSRLIGIHFFNPVPSMKLVEIVRTNNTIKADVERAKVFVKSLNKEFVISNDTPGFIVNYLQYPFRLNAMRMLEKGMASVEDIDKAARLGLGHPMGPLELQDLVGLDITYNATTIIYEKTKDPIMKPPEILKKMVDKGFLGVKTGKGFYDY